MAVVFHKMHGLGNDFILLDLRHQDFPIDPAVAKHLANRRTGIGCDQILILRKPTSGLHLASFQIWNSDGSRCEQCGNGVRCLGLYLYQRSETPDGQFLLGGPAGVVKIDCLDGDLVQVDMGRPIFESGRIQITSKAVDGWYPLQIDGQAFNIGAVSMGNPHALMVVDDLDATDVTKWGAILSKHSAFPQGCNAGFAEIVNRQKIRLQVYERGAAETLACGSGACAAVSILHRAGLVDETVNVTQTGGSLIISWNGGESSVMMTGNATHVFEGKLYE
jgi:diaminopimelate epimerase